MENELHECLDVAFRVDANETAAGRAGANLGLVRRVTEVGNSYIAGFLDLLGKELNMPLHYRGAGGQTTEAFGDMLRDPDVLKDCKVVVWVTTHNALDAYKPLPRPIREMVETK